MVSNMEERVRDCCPVLGEEGDACMCLQLQPRDVETCQHSYRLSEEGGCACAYACMHDEWRSAGRLVSNKLDQWWRWPDKQQGEVLVQAWLD